MSWYWTLAIVLAVIVVLVSRRGESAGSRPPLPNIAPGGGTEADIDAFIRAGHKIEAIKIYRMLHHVGLKEAKDAVEARERALANPGSQA
jgi:ribosomal protein L7/L12